MGEGRADSTLSSLFAPLSLDEFGSRYWRQRHLLCRGAAERFAGLLSWAEFNRLLEHHWREPHRFRLARQGRDLEPATYIDAGSTTPRIRSAVVAEQLRCGATLAFHAVDEVHPPLRRLAEAFESLFWADTQINVYASCRMLHGLDVHRDDEEVFVLQVEGRKRWLLYGFSIERAPLGRRDPSMPPTGALVDETLVPGDLLYVPKGCYHLAMPLNEPTLHLTVGVRNPSAADVLRWAIERQRGTSDASLSPLDPPERRAQTIATAKNRLIEIDDRLLDAYFESGSNRRQRPSFNLPFAAAPDGLPAGDDFVLELTERVQLLAGDHPGSIEVRCCGRRYRFPRAMRRLLEQLDGRGARRMNELVRAFEGALDESAIRTLAAMLVTERLVIVR
jgi:ribosomal protein L16 Arg81 hydroxylase